MEAKVRNWLKKYVINNKRNKLGAKSCLVKSLKLIEKEENWNKGDYELIVGGDWNAEKQKFNDTKYTYCAIGAVMETDGSHEEAAKALLLAYVPKQSTTKGFGMDAGSDFYSWTDDANNFRTTVESYNDRKNTTHRDILNLFRKAIKLCEAK